MASIELNYQSQYRAFSCCLTAFLAIGSDSIKSRVRSFDIMARVIQWLGSAPGVIFKSFEDGEVLTALVWQYSGHAIR